MREVQGLEKFAEYFKDFAGQYVVIGGVATVNILLESGFEARRTKDVDLVILANPNAAFATKLKAFIADGGYLTERDAGVKSKNYRFCKPTNKDFPEQIEIFSAKPIYIEVKAGQVIVPFTGGGASLSAILMDDVYANFVAENYIVQKNGLAILNADGLIILKARAFIDLRSRALKGEKVDSNEIDKHRKDIIRLAFTLKEGSLSVPEVILNDFHEFLTCPDLNKVSASDIKNITGQRASIEEILEILELRYKTIK